MRPLSAYELDVFRKGYIIRDCIQRQILGIIQKIYQQTIASYDNARGDNC